LRKGIGEGEGGKFAAFQGKWTKGTIKGSRIEWDESFEATASDLEFVDATTIAINDANEGSGRFTATLEGNKLTWSDGDTWYREEPQEPPELRYGDEVQANHDLEIEGEEYYVETDLGRVSKGFYYDEDDDEEAEERVKICWYRTGKTSSSTKAKWKESFSKTGNHLDWPGLDAGVIALPGSDLKIEGEEVYKKGDRGRVISDLHKTKYSGAEIFSVFWPRTGKQSEEEKENWVSNLRVIAPGDEISEEGESEQGEEKADEDDLLEAVRAATKIQAFWRGVQGRRLAKRMRDERDQAEGSELEGAKYEEDEEKDLIKMQKEEELEELVLPERQDSEPGNYDDNG